MASGFKRLAGSSDFAADGTIWLKGADRSGRFSDSMPSAIGSTSSSFASISNPLGAGAGSVEIVACGSSTGK